MIELFELAENSKIKPTKHCYTIGALKRIMDEYPDEYLSIYAYLFYMTCMNEDINPFFNVPEEEKEDMILEQVGGNFSTDEEAIESALQVCRKLYETPTYNAFMGIKAYLERIGTYMRTTQITDGKDGNISQGLRVAEKYNEIRRSFNETYKELQEEQSTQSRGGNQIAYDQL